MSDHARLDAARPPAPAAIHVPPQHQPAVRAIVVMVVMSAALAGLAIASEQDAPRLGFLMWFRHEGRGVTTEGTALFAVFGVALALTVGAFAAGGRARWFETAANVAVKISMAGAVAFMLAFPDLPQFEQKSLTVRAILYPALAAIVPLLYFARRMRGSYPTLADLCWSLALTVDIVGNDLHWYGNWKHFDDTVHFLNTLPVMFIIVAVVLVFDRRGVVRIGFWWSVFFGLALYTSLHGFWETSEYLMDRYAGTELQPGGMEEATRNNLSSVLGSLLAVALLWRWSLSGFLERSFVAPMASYVRGGGRRG
jgi:hypothetical protein